MKAVVEINDRGQVIWWCPGCLIYHCVWTAVPHPNGSRWTWNNDRIAPTFSPSVLYPDPLRCHSLIANGRIQFLADCHHGLANTTVPMIPLDEVAAMIVANATERVTPGYVASPLNIPVH